MTYLVYGMKCPSITRLDEPASIFFNSSRTKSTDSL